MIANSLVRLSRGVSGSSRMVARSISGTNDLLAPADDEKIIIQNKFSNLRLAHSSEPVPYTGDIEVSPLNCGIGKLGHKKVTVVGCGQVGMAIAYAMLNQVTAGTIALVDMNKSKLEGEAKDLEQGSAFHQNVRILASDEYVSCFDFVGSFVSRNRISQR
jgi:threonine dehydrogenase-like Zn-dependent dehydrogenase